VADSDRSETRGGEEGGADQPAEGDGALGGSESLADLAQGVVGRVEIRGPVCAPVCGMTPLARLIAAVDGYLASKGTEDQQVWVRAFNELMAALKAAKEVAQ
jgi:hypothetical protein